MGKERQLQTKIIHSLFSMINLKPSHNKYDTLRELVEMANIAKKSMQEYRDSGFTNEKTCSLYKSFSDIIEEIVQSN